MPTQSEVTCENFLKDLTKLSKLHKVVIVGFDKSSINLRHLSCKHNYHTGHYVAEAYSDLLPEKSENVRWENE